MTNNLYQKYKERFENEPRETYQNFTEGEKEVTCNKNLSEEQKQKIVEKLLLNYYSRHSKLLLKDFVDLFKDPWAIRFIL